MVLAVPHVWETSPWCNHRRVVGVTIDGDMKSVGCSSATGKGSTSAPSNDFSPIFMAVGRPPSLNVGNNMRYMYRPLCWRSTAVAAVDRSVGRMMPSAAISVHSRDCPRYCRRCDGVFGAI